MIYSAFILGLVSSLHCIGMCGPIAMMLPVDRKDPAKQTMQVFIYHAGRLTAYGTLGVLFGILGRGFHFAGLQQQFSIIAGLLIIAVALVPERIFAKYNFSRPVYRVISNIKSGLGSQFKKRGYKALFVTGLLNGFLPCALVYAALFGALAMQSITGGILYMMLFGAGTIPLMSLVVYSAEFIKTSARISLAKSVPYVVALIGMLFIVRGLGLGIPYMSPGDLNLFVQLPPDCK